MGKKITQFIESVEQTLKLFPVEIGIILYAFVMSALLYEDVNLSNEENIALAPLFFSLAYILNNLIRSPRGRWAYYLCWLPVVPLWLVDVGDFIDSPQYVVSLICAFLGFLICRRPKDNAVFAKESIRYLVNLIIASVYAGVAHLLLIGIYYSINYIFGMDSWGEGTFLAYSSMLAYIIAVPTMFLTFCHSNLDKEWQTGKFMDVLLNFIITPALLIYTAILYIYFVKIAVLWSLPRGWVSILVFIFSIVAILVKAWQPLLSRRYYDWFFDRFSLISLPALLMFWIGVGYRVSQYGLTEMRVYLLICGVIMTATVLMFLCRNWGRYTYVAVLSMALFALFTYIPPLTAENVALRSHRNRAEKIARRLDMLDADGEIKAKEDLPPFDSTLVKDYEKLINSVRYVGHSDYNIFGPDPMDNLQDLRVYTNTYGGSDSDYGQTKSLGYIYLSNYGEDAMSVEGYRMLYKIHSYRYGEYYYADAESEKMLKVYRKVEKDDSDHGATSTDELIHSVSFEELLRAQLAKVGYTPEYIPEKSEMEEIKNGMFEYEADSIKLVFSNFSLERSDAGRAVLRSFYIDRILLK